MDETYAVLSVAAFLLAGMFGMASVVCWFQFDIPGIVGELSGRAAKKAAERAREAEEKTADNVMIIHTDERI